MHSSEENPRGDRPPNDSDVRSALVSPPRHQVTKPKPKMKYYEYIQQILRIDNDLARALLAEFLGTFIFVCFVDGAVAQATMARTLPQAEVQVAWGVGCAVGFGVYISFGVSGGHTNPSITFAVATAGHCPWYKVFPYMVAQCAGGLLGGFVVYALYAAAIWEFSGDSDVYVLGVNATAHIFATFPKPHCNLAAGFFEQVINTGLVLAICMSILDQRNAKVPSGLTPFLFGHSVFAVILCFNYNTGAALNPARDFTGRIVLSAIGYDSSAWTANRSYHWWWVGALGPTVGATVGVWLYFLFVGWQHPPLPKEDEVEVKSQPLESYRTQDPEIEVNRL
ncbi:aquaporin-9-like isoform X1 [Diadema setosum]|uniref:aquaporin-9-like isoform X1 n=1 Tax=Diadema setosum TaxID=31175 RepID=UPI003B3AFAA1